MTFRALLPYQNLQTARLGFALGAARAVAWVGVVVIALGAAYIIFVLIGGGMTAAASPTVRLQLALSGLVFCAYGLGVIAFSGILAALVGIDDSLRHRV